MSVEHCGAPRDTAYCPDCGVLLDESQIHILKNHVDDLASRAEIRLQSISPESDPVAARRVKKLAFKWHGRQKALKELIDG